MKKLSRPNTTQKHGFIPIYFNGSRVGVINLPPIMHTNGFGVHLVPVSREIKPVMDCKAFAVDHFEAQIMNGVAISSTILPTKTPKK